MAAKRVGKRLKLSVLGLLGETAEAEFIEKIKEIVRDEEGLIDSARLGLRF